jgi:acetylornithine/succinyldiaminopimelate/putrescine aminotransferase
MKTKEKDRKYFGRGSEALDLNLTKAKGSLIYDEKGKKYIDFLGGSGVGSLGWDNEEIEREIRKNDRPSYVYPHFYYEPWTELAKLLAEITPAHLTTSFRTTGGSEAVEAAIQMAMMYTGRKKFLSIEGSYHGNTIAAISLGASSKHSSFPNLLPGCEKIETPLDEKALELVEEKLKNKEVAAFIMEPIICNLGVVIPSSNFMEKLDDLCKTYGTLLIMDEAITGFGRTGKLFATEHYNIKPDMICMAKAMSAGHAGIGAVIITDEIADKVEEEVGLYSSYGWHPISVDASLITIKYLKSHREDLFQNVSQLGQIFKEKLGEIKFKNGAEIRIKGLAVGIDVKEEEYATNIKEASLEHGLLMNTEGSSLVFFPALNIERNGIGRT